MKFKGLLNSRYIGWLIFIAAIIFWYFYYFFSYVPMQESKLRERSFRILEEYSKNMVRKLQYYQNHFENYGPYYHVRELLEKDTLTETTTINITSNYFQLDTTLETGNSLSRFLGDTLNYAVNVAESLNPTVHRRDRLTDTLFQKKGYEGNYEPSFYFPYKDHQEVFIVPLTTFMRGLRFDRLFDNIVLFDSTEVYFNTDSEIVYDLTNPGAILDSTRNQQGGLTKTIQVQGIKKQVMVLPVDVVKKRFYLAGIISDTAFKKKTRAINFQLMIFISGLLLVLLVGMPVMKIILTDTNDHMDAADSHRAAISLIVSAGILVLVTIGAINYKVVDRNYQRKRLKNISETVYQNIEKDLNLVVDFYEDLTAGTDSFKYSLSQEVKKNIFDTTGFFKFTGNEVFPFPVNEILLINSTGKVRNAISSTNLSIDETNVNFNKNRENAFNLNFKVLDLNQRMYFQNAIDTTKSWYNRDTKRHFYIQSITSYNTGHNETAISFYLKNKATNEGQVLAITSEVPSFYKQILPQDIHFAIVNESGGVLYHSIPNKNLHENFLDESGSNPLVKTALQLRIVETAKVYYNEKPWFIRTIPLKNAPLTLVTMLDVQQMQNRNTRIILFTFYFFMITLICIITGVSIIRLSRPRKSSINSKSWFFNWLVLQNNYYMRYKFVLFSFAVIILLQGVGGFWIEKPVTMFVYQLNFIVFTGLVSLVVLGKRNPQALKIFEQEHFPPVFLVFIWVLIAGLLLRLQFDLVVIAVIIILLGLMFYMLHATDKKWLEIPANSCSTGGLSVLAISNW